MADEFTAGFMFAQALGDKLRNHPCREAGDVEPIEATVRPTVTVVIEEPIRIIGRHQPDFPMTIRRRTPSDQPRQ